MKIKIILKSICIVLYFVFSSLSAKFETLNEIEKFAAKNPEYPAIDNQNYLNPDFKTFYEKTTPTQVDRFLDKTLSFFYLKKELWSPENFASLLKTVTEQQEKNWGTGNYIIKYNPTNKTNFVIWGDTQGAFHSLARTLSKLKEDSFLNKDLKIIKPDCFFIFNGNAIGRSAYIMETLTTILSLMEKNPKQVIYIKGEQETAGNWKNFGLDQQLKYKAQYLSKEQIPLETEITKFLNTLPLAFYIKLPSDKVTKFIRISYFDRNYIPLNETFFADFLQQNSINSPEILNITDKKPSDKQINIEAIIEGKDRSLHYQKIDGLQLSLPDKGATAWSIFSCPTLTSKKVYDFSNDAFVILTVDPKEKLNLITLYKQNAIEKKGFSKKAYNVISEELIKEEAPKVEKILTKDEKIVIGSSSDLFGVSYIAVKQIYEGINIYFKKLNASGGIHGKEIKYIVLNDQYNPTLANENINTLLDTYKTNIILVIGGTPTTKAALPKVESKEILVAFPHTGASIFRKPELTHFIHMKTSYEKESFALTSYAINQMKLTKFALLYQNDDFGLEFVRGAKEAFEKYGIKEWCQAPYKADADNIEQAAKKIAEFNPQAIMLFSREKPTLNLIERLGVSALANKNLFAGSYFSDEFKEQLNNKGLKITLSTTIPNPKDTNLEIVKDYQNDIKNQAGKEISVNTASLAGYIYAEVFAEILKRIDGEITKEKIIEQAEKIKNENFKGLNLNFDPQTKELFKNIWINTSDNQWIEVDKQEEAQKSEKEISKPMGTEAKKLFNVGINMDLSSVLAPEATQILNGITIRFREENASSKINNIKSTFLDNKLENSLIKSNTEKLLKSGINIFLQPTGSFILENMLPILKDKTFFLLNGATSPIFYKPDFKNFINYFPSSYKSATILTEYIIKTLNKKKIAIVYQIEPYGQGAFEGCKDVFKKYNLQENTDWIAIGHEMEKIDDPKIVASIKRFNPDVIIMVSFDTAIKTLINFLGADYLLTKLFTGIEGRDEIKQFLSSKSIKFVFTHLVPNPELSNLELVEEYRKAKKNKGLSERELEGYFAASLLLHFINNIKGEVTPQKLLEFAESLKNQEWKGFNLNFDPNTRSILSDVWLDKGDGKLFLHKEEKAEETPKIEEKPKAEIKAKTDEISSNEKRTIQVGVNLDLTNVLASQAKPGLNGIATRIREENAQSKINNIKLTHFNNELDPIKIKSYTEELLKKGIDIFLQPAGSFILDKMLPMLKDKPVFIFNGTTSPIFYKPELKNLINYFASSYQSATILTEYIINVLKKNRIAIIYQLEPFAQGAFEGCKNVLKKHNLKENSDWIALGHNLEKIDDPNLLKSVKEFSPTVIIMVSFDAAMKTLINFLGVDFLYAKLFTLIEGTNEIKQFLSSKKISYISTHLVPNFEKSNLEVAQKYRKAKENINLSEREFEGYIATSLLLYIINNIKGEVTPQKLLEFSENLKNQDWNGFNLNFDPNTRSINSDVWLDKGDGNLFLYKEKIEEKPESVPTKVAQIIIPATATKEDFVVGNSMDLSKGGAHWGKAHLRGMVLSINKTNKEGGIHGRKIKLINYDDKNNPNLSLENVQNLISKGIEFILNPFGGPSVQRYLPLAIENKIAIIFSGSSDPALYKPELKNLINFFLSSKETGKTIAEYAITNLNLKKFAIFYEMDSYSKSALDGAIEIFQKFNLKEGKDWIAEAHQPDTTDILPSANKIKDFSPQGIFLFAVHKAHTALLDQLGIAFLNEKIILPLESDGEIVNALKKRNLKFATTQTLPSIDSDLEITKQLREEIKKQEQGQKEQDKSADILVTVFASYLATELFVDIVKNLQEPITKEKVIEAIEKIKDKDFRGIKINFDPKTRAILQNCYIYTMEGKVIPYIISPEEKKEAATGIQPTPSTPSTEKPTISTDKTEIKIGANLDLSGSLGLETKPSRDGILIRFRQENKQNKSNNFKLVYQDNKSQNDLILSNAEKMLSEGINIFLQSMGSSIIETMLPIIKDKPVAVFCAATSPTFRKSEFKNFINCYPSSFQSAQSLTDYIVKKLSKKRLVFVYQQETYGQGAYEGFLEVIKKNNLQKNTDWIEFSYKINEAVSRSDADIIKKFNPEAIIAATYDSTLKEFIYLFESEFLLNRSIGVLEISNELKDFLSKRNLKIISTQILPDISSNLEIVNEYKTQPDSKKSDDKEMEGYISASILLYLINKIEGKITPQKLLQVAENIKNQDFKGLTLNFNPNTRSIFEEVRIDIGDGKPFVYKTEKTKEEITPEKVAPTKIKPIKTSKEDFVVGTILDTSATNAIWGKPILRGLNLNINKANREGGINGRNIKLIHFDDKSTPQLARENAENLLKKEIDIILHPLGNSSIESYLPLAKENKIAIIFSASSSPSLYKPEPKNMTSFYPSSTDLGKAITEYAIKELKLNKFVVFYQTESYSKSGLDGAKEVFEKNNLKEGTNWIAISHQPNSINFTQEIHKIKEFSPKAILLFSVFLAHRTLIDQLGIEFLHDKILLGLESDGKIINLIRKDNLKFATAQLLPNPDSKDLKIAQEYRKETKEELNDTEFGAYLACDLFVDILRKIQEPITKEKIIEAIEQIKDHNFKGININFNPATRTVLKEVFINNLSGEIITWTVQNDVKPSAQVTTQPMAQNINKIQRTANLKHVQKEKSFAYAKPILT